MWSVGLGVCGVGVVVWCGELSVDRGVLVWGVKCGVQSMGCWCGELSVGRGVLVWGVKCGVQSMGCWCGELSVGRGVLVWGVGVECWCGYVQCTMLYIFNAIWKERPGHVTGSHVKRRDVCSRGIL